MINFQTKSLKDQQQNLTGQFSSTTSKLSIILFQVDFNIFKKILSFKKLLGAFSEAQKVLEAS